MNEFDKRVITGVDYLQVARVYMREAFKAAVLAVAIATPFDFDFVGQANAHRVDGCQHVHGPRGTRYYREVWVGYRQPRSCVNKMYDTGATRVYYGGKQALLRMFRGNIHATNRYTQWYDSTSSRDKHCIPMSLFPSTTPITTNKDVLRKPNIKPREQIERNIKARVRKSLRRTKGHPVRRRQQYRLQEARPRWVRHPKLGVIPWNKAMMLLCSQPNCGK